MPKFKNRSRSLVLLVNRNEQVIEKRIVKLPLTKVASIFDIQNNLDQGDKIIIESEEL